MSILNSKPILHTFFGGMQKKLHLNCCLQKILYFTTALKFNLHLHLQTALYFIIN